MSETWIQNIASRQPALTESDKLLRDNFVDQFLLDYNPIKAVVRLGYNVSYAEHMANQFMLDSYVLNKIEQGKREPRDDRSKLKDWVTAELMSRAQYEGPGSSEAAKIAAIKTLIDLHGLGPDTKIPIVNNNTVVIDGQFEEVENLTLEDVIAQCKERGLPTSIFVHDELQEI